MISKILRTDPFIAVIDGIIPDATLEKMLAETEYTDSTGYDNVSGASNQTDYRTSSTFYAYAKYEYLTDYILDFLSEDIGHTYNRPMAESWQLTKYTEGQYYRPHWDYFHEDFETSDSRRINRVATLIVYLNDDFEGGQTTFPTIDLTIQPKAGRCLYFTYPGGASDTSSQLTYHEATPVVSGTKKIANLWLRDFRQL